MAKHIILESYTFDKTTRTVTILNKVIRREQLVLITNVTSNTVIYNFADSSLTASSYTISTTGNVESTTIVLTYNTTSMNNTDKLAILVDETNESFQPAETFMDPVGKMRVSTPQSLIDTDFEYGVQPTKWESVSMMMNRPGAFFDPTASTTFTSIVGNGTRVVTINLTNTTGFSTTTPIYIQDCIDPNANGWYLPSAVSANVSITYTARGNVANQIVSDPSKTYLYLGYFYSGAGIPVTVSAGGAFTYSGTTVTGTTVQSHGLQIGSAIFVSGTTASTNAPNGAWFVRQTPTANTFVFDVVNAPTGTIQAVSQGSGLTVNTTVVSGGLNTATIAVAGTNYLAGDIVAVAGGTGGFVKVLAVAAGVPNSISIYAPGTGYTSAAGATTTITYTVNSLFARTWGSAIHRPFDGGVTFTAGYPYHGNQLIRQTRRSFRYQSGKGIQFSTGSNMCNPWYVDTVTASGATVTVTTKFPHNVGVGAVIKVFGADQAAYNGTFTVASIPTDLTFTYTAASSPSASPATGSVTVQPYQWYGASLRLGMFNNQNGFFFQYDGQTLWAVRRSSTTQLSGYISVLGSGSHTVTGVNTKFSSQLLPTDFVVIRGQSYMVLSIESDTAMTIYPDYRGPAIVSPAQVIISKTVDTKIAQSSWNIDKADGTGHTGFNLDVTKMQMWYIDYTWYGAGAIRWGFRNSRGEIQYVNRMAHGNNMTEAYMRSGNLPGRYEVNTFWPATKLSATLSSSETGTISVADTTGFATTGTLQITNYGAGGAIEYIGYTGKTGTTFTGLTRGLTNLTGPGGLTNGGGSAATTFTYSATAAQLVNVYSPQAAATISHWGSSVMMDGRYDDDKSLIFVAGMSTAISNIGAGVTQPLITIRVAPSVDSGITGILGQREIINTMQLVMRACDVYTTGASMTFLITLRLNGFLSGGTFAAAGGSSLSQVAFHTGGQTITGGETIYGFFTTTPGVTQQDLIIVRDLGTNLLGGGLTLAVPTSPNNRYPDGPDILTICATNVTAVTTNSINARISWSEAQA